MKSIEVISLDMFQTLVNLDNRLTLMWTKILNDKVDVKYFQSLLLEQYFAVANQKRNEGKFVLTKEIYRECFNNLFSKFNIKYDSANAVNILVEQHRQAEFYEETVDFLNYAIRNFQVCIVSDTDEDMLPCFFKEYSIPLFSSEKYGSYKNDHKNLMFRKIIEYFNVKPNQVIHIGDTTSDIFGAKRAGIRACWINRYNEKWKYEQKPDYIIDNLNKVKEIVC